MLNTCVPILKYLTNSVNELHMKPTILTCYRLTNRKSPTPEMGRKPSVSLSYEPWKRY